MSLKQYFLCPCLVKTFCVWAQNATPFYSSSQRQERMVINDTSQPLKPMAICPLRLTGLSELPNVSAEHTYEVIPMWSPLGADLNLMILQKCSKSIQNSRFMLQFLISKSRSSLQKVHPARGKSLSVALKGSPVAMTLGNSVQCISSQRSVAPRRSCKLGNLYVQQCQ